MSMPEVLIACARPADVPRHDWHEIAAQLDDEELHRAQRLRFEEDRRAYTLAHALLRALVAAESGLRADEIHVAHDIRGRPFVERAPELHVSLTRTRAGVACAATRAAPVGVDLEHVDSKPVDAGLLGAFIVTLQPVTAQRFFYQWTALEAFWKSCGTGLADGQPRICCVPRPGNRFDVHLEHSRFDQLGTGGGSSVGCAGRGAIVDAFADCALAVVLCAPIAPLFLLKRTRCACAQDIRQLARAKSTISQHAHFCVA